MADAGEGGLGGRVPPRVFVSYAHDDAAYEERVRDFWLFLRASGVDAVVDLPAAEQRVDWTQWMTGQIRDAGHILVIASPRYKERAEGDAQPGSGRGVQWEAGLIQERIYRDQPAGLQVVLPVVLPGGSADDIPLWLRPYSTTHFEVADFTRDGAEKLLRVLTCQPWETVPPLGPSPVFAPRGHEMAQAAAGQPEGRRPGLRTVVLITASMTPDGLVASSAWLAGALLGRQEKPLPADVRDVWNALELPAPAAADRMVRAGRQLARVLLDDASQQRLAAMLAALKPGDAAEVVVSADGSLLSLPAELIRLATVGGGEVGPLGLMPGVSVSRWVAGPGPDGADPSALAGPPPPGLAGPLKVLAAVAAPDETKTKNQPLDTEAEMQAVLDAVAGVASQQDAQVRILEVASLPAIRQALERDAYHVLHLSAHGSPDSVELEDEDGNPAEVTARSLTDALQHAGQAVPLIVLSSCSGGATGSEAMAAGLIARGAGRVIAMLAPVRAAYATMLTRHLYEQLATRPGLTAGRALARARYLAEEQWSQAAGDRLAVPQYGLPALLTRAGDAPLTDPAAARAPLSVATAAPGGGSVRELPMGDLIGRRPQLRTAMSVLRGTPRAVQRYGASSGVVLTGIGGIGKTALAGRVMSRLREEGWLIAVHEGRWNPTALITAAAQAITGGRDHPALQAQAGALRDALALLTDPGSDDGPKLAAVTGLLARQRLLVVLDDFEQNLGPGGEAFLDPAFDEVITALADAARTGELLITSRYPLPGPDRFLTVIPLLPLSVAELRRMFLRMPQLADLPSADQLLLIRTIGGHPRLIEFTDALLRGGRASLHHVQARLRDLAQATGIDVRRGRPVAAAVDQAMIIGSADILLSQLLTLLTGQQAAICRAPMTLGDLAFTLSPAADPARAPGASPPDDLADQEQLRADTSRLADLTLLTPGPDIAMHPWTAELVTRNTPADTRLHERALAMRLRRFSQQRGSYEDLLDIPRHLAALHRWDDIADVARQAVQVVSGTLATLACLAEIRPLIPPAERAWILVADLEVQALLSAGDLPAATRQLEDIHQQVEAHATADPTNLQWQHFLSVSHERLGDVAVAAGDLAAGRAAYQASLDIAARLVAADPAGSEAQRQLSVGHNKLGDVAVAAGDLAAARSHYQASLDIAVRLAAADPANTGWQRDLSISHDKLGDVAVAAGDLAAARSHYQASLDIAVRLAAADPANTEWQRDLSITRQKIDDLGKSAEEA